MKSEFSPNARAIGKKVNRTADRLLNIQQVKSRGGNYWNFSKLLALLTRHGRMDRRTFEIEFKVDDIKVELMHGYKIGNAWERIRVQP